MQFKKANGPLELSHLPIPIPQKDQVRIKVKACGICHTDAMIQSTAIPAKFPITPGHEVAGIIDEVGEGVTIFKKGDYVGVGYFGGSCGVCTHCARGDQLFCAKVEGCGSSYNGGYAEFMVAPVSALARLPDGLPAEEAAPLMCAGLTTFNALRHSCAIAGDLVVIQGLGGLGHLGVQFSNKLGFKTAVVSRGSDKEKLAKSLGAHYYIDSEKCDPVKEIQALGGARVILATAPSAKAMQDILPALGYNSQMIMLAVPSEPFLVHPWPLLGKKQCLMGWPSGNSHDSEDTAQFSLLTGVKPLINIYPLEQAQEAFDSMMTNKARFRAVLKMN